MTNFAVMGSCLANMTGVFLSHEYGWNRLNNATIYRSDHFLTYCVDRSKRLPPFEEIVSALEYKPEYASLQAETEARIRENYPESVGRYQMAEETNGLLHNMNNREIDVILMDNLFDTETRLAESLPLPDIQPYEMYLPLGLFSNVEKIRSTYTVGAHLSGKTSATHWLKIIEFVRSIQPDVKIIFLAGHYCTSLENPGRYNRAFNFYKIFSRLCKGKNITIVPPLNLPPELTKMPDDFAHYDLSVYRALAGYIQLGLIGNWSNAPQNALVEV